MNLLAIRPTFSIRNLMAGLAVLAVTMASIKGLEPTSEPPLSEKNQVLLQVATRLGPDGREIELPGDQLATALRRMTSPAVLDTALADPWLSSLPSLKKAADPRAELRRWIHFRSAQSSVGPGVVVLAVESPIDASRATHIVARAIAAGGPPLMSIRPRFYRGGPLDRPWKVATAWAFGLAAALLTLMRPLRNRRREPSNDRGTVRAGGDDRVAQPLDAAHPARVALPSGGWAPSTDPRQ
jgi:hypothetical protein